MNHSKSFPASAYLVENMSESRIPLQITFVFETWDIHFLTQFSPVKTSVKIFSLCRVEVEILLFRKLFSSEF